MLALLVLWLAQAAPQPPPEADATGRPDSVDNILRFEQRAAKFIDLSKKLSNWDEQYEQFMAALETVFDRYGFDSEADQYALELMRTVEAVPPWDVRTRIDTLMGMLSERYTLDDAQRDRLQQILLQTSMELLGRHRDEIFALAGEIIETRAAGRPFEAAQVARWIAMAEPITRDGLRTMRASFEDFADDLNPAQRQVLQRDFDAGIGRIAKIEEASAAWRRGEWTPADWGLEHDPIQNAAPKPGPEPTANEPAAAALPGTDGASGPSPNPPAASPGAAAPGATSPGAAPRRRPAPDDAWARWVRAFISRYELDLEQQQRAWQIYDSSIEQADVVQRIQARRRPTTQPASTPASSPAVQRIFERLKTRLERLPTQSQRRRAQHGSG